MHETYRHVWMTWTSDDRCHVQLAPDVGSYVWGLIGSPSWRSEGVSNNRENANFPLKKIQNWFFEWHHFVGANHSQERVITYWFTSTEEDSAAPCSFNSLLGCWISYWNTLTPVWYVISKRYNLPMEHFRGTFCPVMVAISSGSDIRVLGQKQTSTVNNVITVNISVKIVQTYMPDTKLDFEGYKRKFLLLVFHHSFAWLWGRKEKRKMDKRVLWLSKAIFPFTSPSQSRSYEKQK